MKLVAKVLMCLFLILSGIVSAILGFIEIRFLVMGEFTLMNNPSLAFAGYLFRFLFFLWLFFYNFYLLFAILFKRKLTIPNFLVVPILIISSIFSIFFYSTYIFFLVIFIAAIPSIAALTKRLLE